MYKFKLTEENNVTIDLTSMASSSNGDLFLIKDSNGNGVFDGESEILKSSQKDGNADEQIVDALASGEYFVLITQVEGSTSYELSVEAVIEDIDKAPSGFDDAIDLGTISNATESRPGSFSFKDEADMYKFNLASRSDVTIDLTGMLSTSNGDVFLIKDSDGNGNFDPSKDEFFGSSQNSNNADEQIVRPALATGEYYVLVTQVEGLTNYNLSVQAADTTALIEDDAGADYAASADLGTITGPLTKTGSFSATDLSDMYKVNFASDAIVNIELSGLNANNYAELFLIQDTNGNGNFEPGVDTFVDFSQNRDGSDQTISKDVSKGEYYVLIAETEGAINYDLAFTTLPLVEDNAGSDFPTAANLGQLTSNITKAASVSSNDLTDVFSFTTAPNITVNLTLSGLDATNYADVFLVKDNGDDAFDPNTDTIIGFSQNDDGSDQAIDNALLAGGEYYVVVTQVLGAMNYSLTLDVA
jgi:hypothetical protein